MPYFKVFDTFALHPKAISAGNAAVGLWARAGSWCCLQLTDGFVPDDIVTVLGGSKKDADALVKAGLWLKEPGGYRFHEWAGRGRNWTRKQIEERRANDRQRKRSAAEGGSW